MFSFTIFFWYIDWMFFFIILYCFTILWMSLVWLENLSVKPRFLAKSLSVLWFFLDHGLLDLSSDYGPFKTLNPQYHESSSSSLLSSSSSSSSSSIFWILINLILGWSLVILYKCFQLKDYTFQILIVLWMTESIIYPQRFPKDFCIFGIIVV